jgi:hypothetical protein
MRFTSMPGAMDALRDSITKSSMKTVKENEGKLIAKKQVASYHLQNGKFFIEGNESWLVIMDEKSIFFLNTLILLSSNLNSMKKKQLAFVFIGLLCGMMMFSSWTDHKKKEREFYQLTAYHFSSTAQEKTLDNYFQNALLPALHRDGIKNIGVFKSWANDTATDKLMYVLVPIHSLDMLTKLPEQLKKDEQYNNAAADYLNADYKNPPYTRMENIILHAFRLAPEMKLPSLQSPKRNRVYELRSYESATEKKFENKVQMFNEGGEIDIFNRLHFNPIFYSEVIAGNKMPNLMYMTSFENRADREAHWKAFGNDTAWKKLSSSPEYQNNVAHIDINFLYPADYSDF